MEAESVSTSASIKPKNKGGRPRKQVLTPPGVDVAAAMQAPEIQAMIAHAVAAATSDLMGKLAAKREEAGTAPAGDDMSMVRKLALAIGEVADQGSNKKRIAPEVMEKRNQARQRMEDFILDHRASGLMPEYELTRAVYLMEELISPTFTDRDHVMRRTRIEWEGVPNEGMVPLNEPAKQVYGAFMEWIGGATPNVNRPADKIQERVHSGLKVLHKDETPQASPVGKPRGGVKKLGRYQDGDVIETRVLGTVAEPARQVA